MKTQKNKSTTKKPLLVVFLVLLLVIGAGVAFAYSKNLWPFSKISVDRSTTTTPRITDTQNQSSQKSEQSTPPVPEDPSKKSPEQHEGDNPNSAASIWGVINYSQVINNTLSIRVTIDQHLSSGNCTLRLSKGSTTVTQQAEIVTNPSSSTCKGFDIPVSQLEKGEWNIDVNVTADNKSGTITGTVSL